MHHPQQRADVKMALQTKKLTILDRSVSLVVPKNVQTKTIRDCAATEAVEKLHRWHGSSVLREACQLLEIGSCFPSAAILYHRCCHATSLKEASVWSIAMASVLLACKLEEVAMTARQVISVFAHIHRRRHLLADCDEEASQKIASLPGISAGKKATKLSVAAKRSQLADVPPMSPLGPVYKDWHDAVIKAEQDLLRRLGFVLYWIPDQHAHRYLPKVLEELNLASNTQLAQRAWGYCNDAYRSAICIENRPEVLACTVVLLASRDLNMGELPQIQGVPWWQCLCAGNDRHSSSNDANVEETAAALLDSIQKESEVVLAATMAFVPSLVEGGVFCDPSQFTWYKLEGGDTEDS